MRQVYSLIGLLIALVVVMVMFSRQARRDLDAVKTVNLAIREEVAGRPYDSPAARRLADRLDLVSRTAELPVEELREAAATTAAWAAGSAPASAEYHAAVKLRAAAVELLGASSALDDPRRQRARTLVAEAMGGSPASQQPGAIRSVRDQLQNLQTTEKERLQETERQLP